MKGQRRRIKKGQTERDKERKKRKMEDIALLLSIQEKKKIFEATDVVDNIQA